MPGISITTAAQLAAGSISALTEAMASNAPVIGHYINGQVHDSMMTFSNVFNRLPAKSGPRVGLALKTVDEARRH